ncbi:hypothetical protein DFH07DRAFT_1066315 [Mycena maculata]|uniref:Uncharacterized protein n=1 Tax=Mycena maculata TaxID=230809 RepID=A0AAD7HV24_9AGAR|nr:hypothetical protein DFH07DRAFT_1066315 [Mycena maculata]
MSSAQIPATNPPETKADVPRTRFPPFPTAPDGVTIVLFKDFKECGIRVQVFVDGDGDGEDSVEVDGLGIPTVPLRVKHDTDVSKTNPNRKKRSARELAAVRPTFRKEWWEDWAEGEDLRNHGPYNVNAANVDRFHQAASDFQKYRKFPPASTNVQWLWEQFKIFAGLLGTTPVWQKASEKAAEDAEAGVSDDGFDSDDAEGKRTTPGAYGGRKFPPRPRPRAPYELYGKEPVVVQDNDEIRGLLDDARAKKEDRVAAFLEDPGRAIQVFLSSYMKYQGLVWADRHLVYTPHVLRFFVNYLLRNQVLPDRTSERSLRAALQTIDAAARELPRTSTISKALPDDFSRACQGCWGRRADGTLEVDLSSDEDSVSGEPDAKRIKLNPASDAEAAFESVLKEENVEVIKTEDVLPAPVPADIPTPPTPTPASERATTPAPTASESEGEGGSGAWGETAAYDPSAFTPADAWDASPDAATSWAPPVPPSLLPLLGPTSLPLTHAPGIVERSVRRIRSIAPPPTIGIKPVEGEAADAVERALEGCLHRVVLGPWADWDGAVEPELASPRIMRSSVGALAGVGEGAPSSSEGAPSTSASVSTPAPAGGAPKPHDMRTDEITLLVTLDVAGLLCVGMGLGGTWVQLARVQDQERELAQESAPAAANDAPPPKKKRALTKAQKERRGLRYWYVDELMMTLPSYWLV